MNHVPVSPEIAAGLLALKSRIEAAKIQPSKIDETINVAVWNIREFGKVRRTEPAIHYIAGILGQTIVELRDNLEDLSRALCYLGPAWKVVYSDWIDDSGGNKERIAFLFDRRAVTHNERCRIWSYRAGRHSRRARGKTAPEHAALADFKFV